LIKKSLFLEQRWILTPRYVTQTVQGRQRKNKYVEKHHKKEEKREEKKRGNHEFEIV
jgi:hypothetical protein